MNSISCRLALWVNPAFAALLLAGCAHESNTNFRRADFGSRHALKSQYHGGDELNEVDVIGVDRARTPSDEDIQRALARSSSVEMKAGDTVLVVQSGEPIPDTRMINELNRHFRAIPFSGIRRDWNASADAAPEEAIDHAARSLRYAAAQAGAQKIICFWGELEVARHDLSTKTITWLPVVDVIIPDQMDRVRVHLKVALVDVKTGAWSLFRTEPLQVETVTTGWARKHVETPEIRNLKQKSYVAAVNSLLEQRL